MFSSQLGRVARASTSITPAVPRTATACLATSATPSLQPKQRRLSSSKASSSPDGSSNGAKPLASTSEPEGVAASRKDTGRRGSGRRGRDVTAKPKKSAQPDVDGAFETLPRVAGTGHLHPHDISLSSFFSLHRPLSLTTPLPPTTTQETFASIFDIKSKRATNNSNDVIYTLSNTIDQIDPHQQPQDAQDLHWEVIQESPSNVDGSIKHLDGVPRQPKSLEEMISQLRPFMTPPPPTAQANPSVAEENDSTQHTSSSATSEHLSPAEEVSKKSFQTTITVTENTSAQGVKYYTTNSTPMVRIPETPTPVQDALRQHHQHHRQPFLERMRERQMDYEDYRAERDEDRSMQLISVKRQRKLKMKKHKYKKLMKRTRNLRRRLDRN